MRMLLIITCLIIFSYSVKAESIKEILMEVQANPVEIIERPLTGIFSYEFKKYHPHVTLYAKAWLVDKLPEPDCYRFALEIFIDDDEEQTSLGVAKLNLCEDGLPPIPEHLLSEIRNE